jgi:hypothetical protein
MMIQFSGDALGALGSLIGRRLFTHADLDDAVIAICSLPRPWQLYRDNVQWWPDRNFKREYIVPFYAGVMG